MASACEALQFIVRPLRAKSLTACCAVLAVVAVASACPSAARAADPEAKLAYRYAPIVRLVAQPKPCGHGEAFVPTNVDLVLGNPDVALRGPWDKTNLIKVAPTGADLEP